MSDRFWLKVGRPDEPSACWMWKASRLGGGGAFAVGSRKDGTARVVYAHRHAWELVNGPIPEGMVVRHTCGQPLCCKPAHLELGTHQRRGYRGPRNGCAKLDEARVLEIRAKHAAGGRTQKSLAEEYGLTQGGVSAIIRRRNWKHV